MALLQVTTPRSKISYNVLRTVLRNFADLVGKHIHSSIHGLATFAYIVVCGSFFYAEIKKPGELLKFLQLKRPTSLGKKLTKAKAKEEEHQLTVETDTEKLVNYVCGTKLYEESGESIKLKPDSEYPEWLWTLHIGAPKKISELDPNSLEYWRRVRKLGIATKYRLLSLRVDKRDYK